MDFFFRTNKEWETSGLFLRDLLVGQKDEESGRAWILTNGWKGEVTRASEENKAYRKGRERIHASKNFNLGHILILFEGQGHLLSHPLKRWSDLTFKVLPPHPY